MQKKKLSTSKNWEIAYISTAFWLILKNKIWPHEAYIFTFPQENNWLELIAVFSLTVHRNIYHSLLYDFPH